jgi:hypothetical protein
MSPIAPFVLALATAVALASPGLAQTAPAAPAPAGPLPHPRIDISEVRPRESDRAAGAPRPVIELQSRTSIDHRLSGDGVFGALGYFCIPEVSSDNMHQAPLNADAKDDRLLGASVRYAF